MTLGRWTGPRLLDRYGRVATIRGLAVLALVGLLLFVLSPWPGLAFAGVLLWGLGACLGYPVDSARPPTTLAWPPSGSAWSPASANSRSSAARH